MAFLFVEKVVLLEKPLLMIQSTDSNAENRTIMLIQSNFLFKCEIGVTSRSGNVFV